MNTNENYPENEAVERPEAQETLDEVQPKIYVASLSDYNNGCLHGAWLEADQAYEALAAGVQLMLAASPTNGAEEWAIHDFEGFGGVRLSEYEPLSIVSTLALGIRERGPAFAAWANFVDRDPEQLRRFEEAYRGHWKTVQEYAESLLDELGLEAELDRAITGSLRSYVRVDYEGFARDLHLGGDIWIGERDDRTVDIFDAYL